MAILKYNDGKEWKSLYGQDIRNKLDKNKNLSDLTNKEEARQNLELTGDNNHTHYHDDRYIPLIEKEKADRIAEDNRITQLVKNELDKIDGSIDGTLNNINSSITEQIQNAIDKEKLDRDNAIKQEAAIRKQEDTKLQNSINALSQRIDSNTNNNSSSMSGLEEKLNTEITERKNQDDLAKTDRDSIKNKLEQEITNRLQQDDLAQREREKIKNDLLVETNNRTQADEDLLNKINANKNTLSNMTNQQKVNGSSQGSMSTIGDFDSGHNRTTLNTSTGIGSGTYSLNDLLNKLVAMSHTHSSKVDNINCNCNCNCNTHSH